MGGLIQMLIRASQSADRGPRKALGKDLEAFGGYFDAQDCPFQSILVGQGKLRGEASTRILGVDGSCLACFVRTFP